MRLTTGATTKEKENKVTDGFSGGLHRLPHGVYGDYCKDTMRAFRSQRKGLTIDLLGGAILLNYGLALAR